MFLPQLVRPLPTPGAPTAPVAGRIAEVPFSVIVGPRGSYVAEHLAAVIQSRDRWAGCVWLRVGSRHGVGLPELLAGTAAHHWSVEQGTPTEQLLGQAPDGVVVVVEFADGISSADARLLMRLRPTVTARGGCLVAVVEGRSGAARREADLVVRVPELAEGVAPAPPTDGWPSRLARLAGPRRAVVHDVLAATRVWPVEEVAAAVQRGWLDGSLLNRLTRNLLRMCGPDQRSALTVAAASGYWHPQLTTGTVDVASLLPWIAPLETGWGWLRPVWARSLARGLADRPAPAIPRVIHLGSAQRRPPLALDARLLGDFELRVDGRAVTRWNGPRGRSLLRYLLARPRHACPRDELLEEFWPGVGAAAARNRLQVAMSGARRALSHVTAAPVIEYADGGYRIRPDVRVEVDVDAFELAMATGRSAERAGDDAAALGHFAGAVDRYRGDFAADAPYEQWTLLPRETLRIAYVEVLDRCSRIHLRAGRLDECVAIAHRMLDVDPCREDAHRLLMHCHARQGRVYQALRQFEFCTGVLRATLGCDPQPRTVALHDAIRASSARKLARTGAVG